MSRMPGPFGMDRSQPFDLEGSSNPAVIRFFNSVYSWMCVGLTITALVAWLVSRNPAVVMQFGMGAAIAVFVAQIVLVVAISGAINRINATMATLMFLAYSALTGLTFSFLFLVVAHSVLTSAFVITAGTFGVMSVYGLVTKRDLTSLGGLLRMALIGLILASIVTIFWHNTMLQVAVNYLGVLIFVGLTAYDTQKLKGIA